MANYDSFVKGKSSEEILAETAAMDRGPLGEYIRLAAQVRVSQGQIAAQDNVTKHMVDCANSLVASQGKATEALAGSIHRLTMSITRASDESGALGTRIVWLTVLLVAVGLLQAMATAWPYLAFGGVFAGREMPSIELEPSLRFPRHYGNPSTYQGRASIIHI